MPRGEHLKGSEKTRIRNLLRGAYAHEVAQITGRSESTVQVYGGQRYARKRPKYDLVRLVREYEATESVAERAELAARLGFPNPNAMRSMVFYARAHMRAMGQTWLLPGEKSRKPASKANGNRESENAEAHVPAMQARPE